MPIEPLCRTHQEPTIETPQRGRADMQEGENWWRLGVRGGDDRSEPRKVLVCRMAALQLPGRTLGTGQTCIGFREAYIYITEL
jgi:hypothetical protein